MQSSAASAQPLEHDGPDDGPDDGPAEATAHGTHLVAVPGAVAGNAGRGGRSSARAGRSLRRPRLHLLRSDERGTTTAEYSVVTAAAVAFGALLLKLLTGSWGQKILETAFREVIKMLGA